MIRVRFSYFVWFGGSIDTWTKMIDLFFTPAQGMWFYFGEGDHIFGMRVNQIGYYVEEELFNAEARTLCDTLREYEQKKEDLLRDGWEPHMKRGKYDPNEIDPREFEEDEEQ